jgi:ATP-dependent Lon protease
MPPVTPEYTLVRTYLDWLVALPWNSASTDNDDIRAAARILDRNHYGLHKLRIVF